jgi:hypothetical protein
MSGSVSRFDPEAKKVVKQVLDSMILQQEGPTARHLLRERAQLERILVAHDSTKQGWTDWTEGSVLAGLRSWLCRRVAGNITTDQDSGRGKA